MYLIISGVLLGIAVVTAYQEGFGSAGITLAIGSLAFALHAVAVALQSLVQIFGKQMISEKAVITSVGERKEDTASIRKKAVRALIELQENKQLALHVKCRNKEECDLHAHIFREVIPADLMKRVFIAVSSIATVWKEGEIRND